MKNNVYSYFYLYFYLFIYLGFMSLAHTEADIDKAIEIAKEVMTSL